MSDEIHSLLMETAARGKLSAVKILVENRGADPGFSTADGGTPLMAAIHNGHLDVVRYLIEEHDVPQLMTTAKGIPVSALCKAAGWGHVHIVEYLVKKQGEQIIHESDANDPVPVTFAAAMSGNAEMVRYLVGRNCSVHCTSSDGDTPLHWAAKTQADGADVVAYLIDECSCDPLHPDRIGRNSIHLACQFGCINNVKYLVETKNCDPLRAYTGHRSSLHLACQENQLNIVKYVVGERKLDPKQAESVIGHPCHTAVLEGHLAIVKYFIENGHCEPTDISNIGTSLACTSILKDKVEVLAYLIDKGGFDLMNMDPQSLLEVAHQYHSVKCTEYLMQHPHVNSHTDGHALSQLTSEQDMSLLSQGQ